MAEKQVRAKERWTAYVCDIWSISGSQVVSVAGAFTIRTESDVAVVAFTTRTESAVAVVVAVLAIAMDTVGNSVQKWTTKRYPWVRVSGGVRWSGQSHDRHSDANRGMASGSVRCNATIRDKLPPDIWVACVRRTRNLQILLRHIGTDNSKPRDISSSGCGSPPAVASRCG